MRAVFAPTLVLLFLAQSPHELTSALVEVPRSTRPTVAFTGKDYLVVWPDDRLDALRARGMAPFTRTDLWQARVPTDGGVAWSAPLCLARTRERAAVSADPASGAVTVAWLDDLPSGSALSRAVLRPGAPDPVCLGPLWTTSDSVGTLRATWTGARTHLAWANDTSRNVVFSWLRADGTVALAPAPITSGSPGAASLTVGALPGAARLAWVDLNGTARLQDVLENQAGPSAGSERDLAIASGVALDQRGSVAVTQTGNSVVAHFADGGTRTLPTELAFGGLAVVTTGGRWLAASDIGSQVTAHGFDGAGSTLLVSAPGETGAALATDGIDALVVTSTVATSELNTRRVSMSGTTPMAATAEPLLLAPAVLRRPSVAWTGDRWLVVYQERDQGLFRSRYVTVLPDAGVLSSSGFSAQEPVIFTRPDGALLLRSDLASSSSTSLATYDPDLDTLVPGPVVLTSSAPSPAGAATNLPIAQWTATTLYSTGTPSGAPYAEGTPYRSFAAAAGHLWIPFASGTSLKTLWLTDATLGANLMQVPPPQLLHTGTFDRQVVPALAASGDPADPLVLIAWANGRNVQWETLRTDAGVVSEGSVPTSAPVTALAAAASGRDFLLARTDSSGLTVWGVRADGSTTDSTPFGELGEQAGDPVAASSPSGEVAVVWPFYAPTTNTVGLRVLVIDPFAGAPDAGARDAGVPSKDGGVDGGETKDSGVPPEDAGASADAGLPQPDGGVGPLQFDTSGCACSAMAANGPWALLLVLALRRRARSG